RIHIMPSIEAGRAESLLAVKIPLAAGLAAKGTELEGDSAAPVVMDRTAGRDGIQLVLADPGEAHRVSVGAQGEAVALELPGSGVAPREDERAVGAKLGRVGAIAGLGPAPDEIIAVQRVARRRRGR